MIAAKVLFEVATVRNLFFMYHPVFFKGKGDMIINRLYLNGGGGWVHPKGGPGRTPS